MDETALVRHASGLVGTVVKYPGKGKRLGEVASLGDRRSYITYLASITHDSALQLKLPQILIANERQLPANLLKNASSSLPANLHVWRRKSAWNSHEAKRKYLSLLSKSLGQSMYDRYVILVLDVARCHIHPSIVAHAKRCGVRLLYIPGLMTAELQPCDTHLFSQFKSAFHEAWRREKASSAGGIVTMLQWLHVVAAAVQRVLPSTDWKAAFESDGVLARQERLGRKLKEQVGWSEGVVLPGGLPTAEAASLIFPKRLKVDVQAYLTWHISKRRLPQPTVPVRRPLPPSFRGTLDRPLTLD